MLKSFNELDEARKPDAIKAYKELEDKDRPNIDEVHFNFNGVTLTYMAYNKKN